MRQILLLILLFFAGSWLTRKLRQAQEHAQARAGRGGGNDGAPGPGAGAARPNGDARSLPEPMVRCAECGVHTPQGDAVAAGGEYFCSTEHAQRHGAHASGHDAR
ncbi:MULTISPECIES: PP0621 family protein [unclassified Burkholderia]|uniref:PP0621 family protein n=1 Tax=unclassified Burkholderia TaxID=2613784 RepID=UPI000F57D3B4|nr:MULTISPECIES: PP0621 family protein [unclassified Burkholderia]RQR44544.1 deaminase [Burkholderia sp. Bp9131]RQR69635.1 deaminase [Burkholderia sp. Bp9015]RQR78270.1 deaminase [Burkholderia sp. Bp9011]RQR88507.1 deaminase [Burkholderia sp. Bp9010]RQS00401.1 deaminase [Burkholderia sp. Bp8994]